ncbi:hypothetical protein CRE_09316 [Caenorhabditis remanei]|uniref:T20D4.11-like domain-containing protein n=1 Tax=Caenorhabditis remanei TaxID=31234 RepID=E3LI42_CAERE|nr:hypothetical protein CRE_09316 [Caenorhabditis remanei]
MSAVKYLLILINLLFLSGIPVAVQKTENVTLKNCTTEQVLAVQQKCDLLAKEVDGYLEDYDGEISTDEVMKNMTELYEKVTNCYSQFGCKEAVEYNAKLEREASDRKVFNTGIKDCMLEFYGAIYEGSYNCTAGFDWFSKDSAVKRDGFIKGRSCLIEIATNECSNKTLNYLNSDYESFVDLMTVKPSGPPCEGLHYELNDLRCNQPIERAMMQGFRMISKLMPMEDEKKEDYKPIIDFFEKDTTNLTLICVVLKDCLDNSCSLPKGLGDFAGNLCNEVKKAENLNEAFFSCMKHLDDRINGTKYPCTQKYEFVSFFSIQGQKDYFWKDKECARSVMKGECPEGALVDFDAQWEWATNIAMKNEESKNNVSVSLFN